MTMSTPNKADGIGRRIALFRRFCGYSTAAELAKAMSNTRITAATIANIESGRRADISVAQLIEISRTLQISPMLLLVDIFNPSGNPDIRGIEDEAAKFSNQQLANWFAMSEVPFVERTEASIALEELEKAFKQLRARHEKCLRLIDEIDSVNRNTSYLSGHRNYLDELEFELQVNLYALEGCWLKVKNSEFVSLDWFQQELLQKIDRDFTFERSMGDAR